MNKKGLLAITLCAVGLVAYSLYFERAKEGEPFTGKNIVAFGDSLVQGVGATSGNDFPAQLSRLIGEPIINAGVAGDTTASALARLEASVLARNPKIVILLVGANDMLRGLPREALYENLSAIIDRIRSARAGILVVGLKVEVLSGFRFNGVYEKLAKEKSVPVIPDALRGIFGVPEYMYSDNLHLNDAGYARLAEKVSPVLLEMLK